MARRVRVHAIMAEDCADDELSFLDERMWFIPLIAEAAPTTPAINENTTKNPVAAFPIGKWIAEKWAGSWSSVPKSSWTNQESNTLLYKVVKIHELNSKLQVYGSLLKKCAPFSVSWHIYIVYNWKLTMTLIDTRK